VEVADDGVAGAGPGWVYRVSVDRDDVPAPAQPAMCWTELKLRGTTEKFASALFGTGMTKTNALEALVIAGLVRGLSVQALEAALADALGPEATVSTSTVSRLCEDIEA
jgi:Transposase, Mutator family